MLTLNTNDFPRPTFVFSRYIISSYIFVKHHGKTDYFLFTYNPFCNYIIDDYWQKVRKLPQKRLIIDYLAEDIKLLDDAFFVFNVDCCLPSGECIATIDNYRSLSLSPAPDTTSFREYLIKIKSFDPNVAAIHYYFASPDKEFFVSMSSLFLKDKVPCNKLVLEVTSSREKIKAYLLSILSTLKTKDFFAQSLKSATAAIMSRNMSHNIGSHVLAKVSIKDPDETKWKEWGKDIQILSQYLQQRQDFIAQIATEWPAWTYPAWLMKDLMRWFLSQKHLLNYIASSEDLQAHFYEDGNRKNPDIRFHLFKSCRKIWKEKVWNHNTDSSGVDRWRAAIEKICSDDCGFACDLKNDKKCLSGDSIKHTLLYTGKDLKDTCCCLDEDIQLAIPGGIVGYHAFYTILENIIRNGAKHSFTRLKRLQKECGGSLKNNIEERLKIAFGVGMDDEHMDVIVEFFDEDKDSLKVDNNSKTTEYYRCRVYDNVSFVNSEKSSLENSDDTELVKAMNESFRQNIITETGELRKKNWGLAEMRISAGYLQRRDISHIGMGKDRITSGEDIIIRATVSPLGTLAYEFRIPKPKEVGIICRG